MAAATKAKSKKPAPMDSEPEEIWVDTNTGEIVPAPKKDAPKLPYGVSLLEGVTCPECGAQLARTKRDGKCWEVCTKQFAEEPECWYARELPKEGDKPNYDDAPADGDTDSAAETGDTPGDRFEDGGAELGGAQMKTATKAETESSGEAASDKAAKTTKTTMKGKKK